VKFGALLLAGVLLAGGCADNRIVVTTPTPTPVRTTATPTATASPSPTPSLTPTPTPAPTPLLSARGGILVKEPLGF